MNMTARQSKFQPKPPDKGSFPLDHDGACKLQMIDFMKCLRLNDNDNSMCRGLSKAYLQCRMDNNLMRKEDWKMLGYEDNEQGSDKSDNEPTSPNSKIS